MANDAPDIDVSNGTCYTADEIEAPSNMIPCGNDYYGDVACCQAGDTCLTSNACYNQEFGVTYAAGCTASAYDSKVCPEKTLHEDDPWVGLVYCNGSSHQWVACPQGGAPDSLTEPDFCYCPTPEASRPIAFTALATLAAVAKLPMGTSQSINWQAGFLPSATTTKYFAPGTAGVHTSTGTSPSSGTPNTSPPGSGTSTATASSTTTSTTPTSAASPDTSSRGLSTGAMAGIVVGGAAGTVAIIALAALAFFHYRRRRRRRGQSTSNETKAGPEKQGHSAADDNNNYTANTTVGAYNYDNNGDVSSLDPTTPAVSELDSRAARPWSMRSELHGGGGVAPPRSLDGSMQQQQQHAGPPRHTSWNPPGATGRWDSHHHPPEHPYPAELHAEHPHELPG